MKRVFVDTGAWIALGNRADAHHDTASSYYRSLRAPLLTTNYVVDETATHLRYTIGLAAALAFRDGLERAMGARKLLLRWIDARIEREAWGLLEQHADIRLSLTDATSVVVAQRSSVTEFFAFDSDFQAFGFDLRPRA